uniref:Uncharacterized protein n=1 Tax=Biomphalaria glabrata TaxID=6526 RepID=A0A2C9LS49_BIOGL
MNPSSEHKSSDVQLFLDKLTKNKSNSTLSQCDNGMGLSPIQLSDNPRMKKTIQLENAVPRTLATKDQKITYNKENSAIDKDTTGSQLQKCQSQNIQPQNSQPQNIQPQNSQPQKKKKRKKAKTRNINLDNDIQVDFLPQELQAKACQMKGSQMKGSEMKGSQLKGSETKGSQLKGSEMNGSQMACGSLTLSFKTTQQQNLGQNKSAIRNCPHVKNFYLGGKNGQTGDVELASILQDFDTDYPLICENCAEMCQVEEAKIASQSHNPMLQVNSLGKEYRENNQPEERLKMLETKGPFFSKDAILNPSTELNQNNSNAAPKPNPDNSKAMPMSKKMKSNFSPRSNRTKDLADVISPKAEERRKMFMSLLRLWPARVNDVALEQHQKVKYITKLRESLQYIRFFRPINYSVTEVTLGTPDTIPTLSDHGVGLYDLANMFLLQDLMPYLSAPPDSSQFEMVCECLAVRESSLLDIPLLEELHIGNLEPLPTFSDAFKMKNKETENNDEKLNENNQLADVVDRIASATTMETNTLPPTFMQGTNSTTISQNKTNLEIPGYTELSNESQWKPMAVTESSDFLGDSFAIIGLADDSVACDDFLGDSFAIIGLT